MYKVAFDKDAEKEFLKLDNQAQKLIASKVIDLQNGNFSNCQVSPRCTISKAISLNISGKILNISGFV